MTGGLKRFRVELSPEALEQAQGIRAWWIETARQRRISSSKSSAPPSASSEPCLTAALAPT